MIIFLASNSEMQICKGNLSKSNNCVIFVIPCSYIQIFLQIIYSYFNKVYKINANLYKFKESINYTISLAVINKITIYYFIYACAPFSALSLFLSGHTLLQTLEVCSQTCSCGAYLLQGPAISLPC